MWKSMWVRRGRRGSCELHRRRCYHEVSFASHGSPGAVLDVRANQDQHAIALDSAPPDFLRTAFPASPLARIDMAYAPLNPADINMVQGNYPSPYNTPPGSELFDHIHMSRLNPSRSVMGSEGWGIVTHVSDQNHRINVGDVVTMGAPGMGTFRSSFWAPASSLIPLARGQELQDTLGAACSTLPQLGGTALRMLRDFVPISPGDVVLQNAANSGVGFMLSQLAALLHNVRVVSLVRRGGRTDEQWSDLVDHLIGNGTCTKVVAEEDLEDKNDFDKFRSELREMSMTNDLPMLGLNAVGGDSATLVSRCLRQGGTMVTYGGMSRLPVTTSTAQLIFKDLRLVGYWHSRWMVQNSYEARADMMDILVNAVLSNGLRCPKVKEFPLSAIKNGLSHDANQSGEAIRQKVIFRCHE